MSFLQTCNLYKVHNTGKDRVHALQGVTLEIHEGEFVAIMGRSGSGKSTLLSILGGLSHPTEGTVIVDGIDVYHLPTEILADFRREYLGFVFQSFQLIPYLSVVENVLLPLAVTKLTRGEKARMAVDILERVGLPSKARRLSDELSGGEQQRVAIARALVNHPPIILADEPTGNLDTHTSMEIMRLLQDLHHEGRTIIMVTHNPDNLQYADRSIHLRDGKLDLQSEDSVVAGLAKEDAMDEIAGGETRESGLRRDDE